MDNAMFYTKKFDFPVMMIGTTLPVTDNTVEPTADDDMFILSCDLGLHIWSTIDPDKMDWGKCCLKNI